MKLTKMILAIGLTILIGVSFAQTTNDYRTVQSGDWVDPPNWERWDGSAWQIASSFPNELSANLITVRDGHTMQVNSQALNLNRTTVESGGSIVVTDVVLTINGTDGNPGLKCFGKLKAASGSVVDAGLTKLIMENGSEYEYARNGLSLPIATWNVGSTLLLSGLTNGNPGNSANNDYYNLIWNNPSQYKDILSSNATSYQKIRGTLKVVSTGSWAWKWIGTTTNTKTIGKYDQSGGTIYMTEGAGSAKMSLNGDFVMSGGTLTETGTATGCGWDFQKSGTALFNKTGGTISETIYFNVKTGTTLDIVDQPITGAGAFTLNSGAGLIIRDPDGISSGTAASGAIQVTGDRTYSIGANYIYNGTAAQDTGDGLPASVNNLTVDNAAGVNLTQDVTVNGTFTQNCGDLSGSTINVDGYSSLACKYLAIEKNEHVISEFSASTLPVGNFPQRINREWTLNGSHDGYKSVTFYWDAADDGNYDWGPLYPLVYDGSNEYSATDRDLNSNPRWVTVKLPSFGTSGTTYTIGREDGETLPVELSAFTVALYSTNKIQLQWVTQSETNVNGFRIYRNTENLLETAEMLSLFIPATNTSQMKVYIATDKEIFEDGIYYYWLENVDLNGESGFHGPIHISVVFATAPAPEVPLIQGISNAYPNPFNPTVNIVCGMEKGGQTTVQIYNARGQMVKTLFTGTKAKGNFLLQWNGTDQQDRKLPSGVYLIRMDGAGKKSTRKVVLSE